MRHRILHLVRSFGSQSDKDFFFHNLAKTGEVQLSGVEVGCDCVGSGFYTFDSVHRFCCVQRWQQPRVF
jgi:hypothetical protein